VEFFKKKSMSKGNIDVSQGLQQQKEQDLRNMYKRKLSSLQAKMEKMARLVAYFREARN
jgi:hypothetical protein